MKNNGRFKRMTAVLLVLMLALSLIGATAAEESDMEEQGLFGNLKTGFTMIGRTIGNIVTGRNPTEGVFEEESADEEQGFLRNTFGKVKDFTVGAYEKTKAGISSAAGTVRDGFVKVGNAIYEEDEEQGFIRDTFGKAKNFVTETVGKVGDALDTGWNAAKKGASDLVNIIYEEEDETQGFIRDTWRKTKDLAKKVYTDVWEETDDMALSAIAAVSGESVSALEDEEQGLLDTLRRISEKNVEFFLSPEVLDAIKTK